MNTEILLMAYGGPQRLEEVPEFLLDVRGGRETPAPLVAEVTQRYRRIGGGSPILALTQSLANALERRTGIRVRVGMRHWHPYIQEAVEAAHAAGVRLLIAIPLSPFYSRMSVGAYADKLRQALKPGMRAALLHSWHLYPPYVQAVTENVRNALSGAENAHVIFTAHGLPERLRSEGDPYEAQLWATSDAIARGCNIAAWTLAYQSPGRMPEPWMEPAVEDVMRQLGAKGARGFLIVPVGFVCDHVEVLYDIDILLQDLAASIGVSLCRSASLNDSPAFVAALAGLVGEARQNTSGLVVVETFVGG